MTDKGRVAFLRTVMLEGVPREVASWLDELPREKKQKVAESLEVREVLIEATYRELKVDQGASDIAGTLALSDGLYHFVQ